MPTSRWMKCSQVTPEDRAIGKGAASRLAIGTKLTRGDLLHLALMSSENRAAHALGRNYPGGVPAFVRAMNAEGAEPRDDLQPFRRAHRACPATMWRAPRICRAW